MGWFFPLKRSAGKSIGFDGKGVVHLSLSLVFGCLIVNQRQNFEKLVFVKTGQDAVDEVDVSLGVGGSFITELGKQSFFGSIHGSEFVVVAPIRKAVQTGKLIHEVVLCRLE